MEYNGKYAARLSEKEKMEIIADYLQCGNYTEVARHFNTNYENIRYVVTHNIDLRAELAANHEKNKQDVIDFMNTKKQAACDIIELYLNLMQDKAKTEKASVKDLAITLGIVIDKFTKEGASTANEKVQHGELVDAIYGLADKLPDTEMEDIEMDDTTLGYCEELYEADDDFDFETAVNPDDDDEEVDVYDLTDEEYDELYGWSPEDDEDED